MKFLLLLSSLAFLVAGIEQQPIMPSFNGRSRKPSASQPSPQIYDLSFEYYNEKHFLSCDLG